MKYEILREANDELYDAAHYYEANEPGLAARFFESYNDAIERILEAPDASSRISRRFRRYRMSVFPYAIIYERFPEKIRVMAVSHLHRKPFYWKVRARKPKT